ncbi:MAG: hypothetical protein KDD38_10140, partial [Bdellovibrionales bacterium]|nr:hypothetical protein [Bdellovibrionales bacterium]
KRVNDKLDLILITHSHGDHFHIPSLMYYDLVGRPKIVIPVEKTNGILTGWQMRELLENLNLPHTEMKWWEKRVDKDIEITAVPFWGEQPSKTKNFLPEDVRMYGNCYYFNIGGKSILITADAGEDSAGSMVDCVREIRQRHGPIDYLLSIPGEFPEMINEGLPHYLFCLPFDELQRVFEINMFDRDSITLGLEGITEACWAGEVKCFLPYANGARDRKKIEVSNLNELKELLAVRGAHTQIVGWDIGDRFEL